ncbi:MAG TPA: hypothetical protein VGX25_12465 [Actinophytocola sp.]|uniref:hypothetical protein n=1 Tax=Actinophytocola sp. TaxID=1872138 RepID=UPI002DDD30DD|nr:hypothetical protein [Actinophytocola sp.]HEV2780197.1 hypothetical protein [Actinophytocola sp.]
MVRDEEWLIQACEPVGDGWKLACLGTSELVRDTEATFYTELEPDVEPLDPARARLVADDSPGFRRTRLWLEAVLRKTPLPLHEQRLAVAHRMLADDLLYQRRAVAQALAGGAAPAHPDRRRGTAAPPGRSLTASAVPLSPATGG